MKDPQELWQIENKYYNLSPFLKSHPGGKRQLLLGKGQDCTSLFNTTHLFDSYPKGLLKSFYYSDVEEYRPIYSWHTDGFYNTVKKRVQSKFRGDSKAQDCSIPEAIHGSFWFHIRVLVMFLVWCGVTFLSVVEGNLIAASLWGIVALAFGGFGHEALHAGVYVRPWKNRLLALVAMDLSGISSYVYSIVHSTRHHIDTNIPGQDPDVDVHFPILRLYECQEVSFFHRFQHIFVVFFYSLALIPSTIMDCMALITGKWHETKIRFPYSGELFFFLLFKLISIGILYVTPFLFLDLGRAFLVFALMMGIGGFAINLIFAISHKNEEAMKSSNIAPTAEKPVDWGEWQLKTTSNFHHGHWFTDMMFAGLGYQIEHHLFPTVSYSRLPEISKIVRETAREFNIDYNYYPTFAQAAKGHFSFLKKMGRSRVDSSKEVIV